MSFKPMRDKIFVSDLDHGMHTTKGGIIITDDTGQSRGIHARWAKVAILGEDITDVSVGEWVLIEHGRWTNGFTVSGREEKIWRIDNDAIMLVSTENPLADRG